MSQPLFLIDWSCLLGAGAEGEVYLGRSVGTGELLAIKVSTRTDPVAAREQLAAELERCQRAASPGAVGLRAWNLEVERPFLVFELASGGSLADEIRELKERGMVYHPIRALLRVREVLVALGHVHTRGLVHRDVKPGNLLRFGHKIKLADFGTGRSLARASSSNSEPFVGTRMYAPPEQSRGEPVDHRADLYGVGCVLYEMLTGQAPAPGSTVELGKYPNALILPELDAVLRSLLHPDRNHRVASCSAAIELVDRALESYSHARRVWLSIGLGPSPY